MENAEKISSENRVVVRVPGTSANCGSGFDCLGLAVTIHNDLDLTLLENERLLIESSGEGAETIPTDEKNIVWKSVRLILERANFSEKFKGAIIRMENHIPMSRGLGSSAAAIVAGLFAANEIVGKPFNKNDIFWSPILLD